MEIKYYILVIFKCRKAETPLLFAIQKKSVEAVCKLLEFGASLEIGCHNFEYLLKAAEDSTIITEILTSIPLAFSFSTNFQLI